MGACQNVEPLGDDILRRFPIKIELPPLAWRIERTDGKFLSDILDIAAWRLVNEWGSLYIRDNLLEEILLKKTFPGNAGDLINLIDCECAISERYWEKHKPSYHCPSEIRIIFHKDIEKHGWPANDLISICRAYPQIRHKFEKVFNLERAKAAAKRLNRSKCVELFINDTVEITRDKGVNEIKAMPSGWIHCIDAISWQPSLEISNVPDNIGREFNDKWMPELRTDIEKGKIRGNPYFYALRREFGQNTNIEDGKIKPSPQQDSNLKPMTLKEVEKDHIIATLDHFGGNITKAAASLGIDRTTLTKKRKDYGIG
ncbi:MAG: helix-turn-helix domain-containing protein [bacterium]